MFVKKIRSELGLNNSETPPSSGLNITSESGQRILYIFCSAHTRLIDSVLNDAMRIATGCLSPKPTDYLPIHPVDLRRQGATLSLAYCSLMDSKRLLHLFMVGFTIAHDERLRSRHPCLCDCGAQAAQ